MAGTEFVYECEPINAIVRIIFPDGRVKPRVLIPIPAARQDSAGPRVQRIAGPRVQRIAHPPEYIRDVKRRILLDETRYQQDNPDDYEMAVRGTGNTIIVMHDDDTTTEYMDYLCIGDEAEVEIRHRSGQDRAANPGHPGDFNVHLRSRQQQN